MNRIISFNPIKERFPRVVAPLSGRWSVRHRIFVLLGLFVFCNGCHHAASTIPRVQEMHAVVPPDPVASAPAPAFRDVTQSAGIHFRHQNFRTPQKYMIETMGSGCAFIDYDGDGWQDILLLNGAHLPGSQAAGHSTLALYHNNHDGTFTDVTRGSGLDIEMYAMGVAVGDYDNDGREDLYITCVLGSSHLFHNDGNGHFTDVTRQAGVENAGRWGTSCAWVDYDRDGKLDLFVCNYVKYPSLAADQPCYAGGHQRIYCIPVAYETSSCTLYHNEGNGRFKDVTAASGIGGAHGKSLGVAIADYDGDGWPDIFVANDTVPGFLFHNEHNGTFKEIGVESGVAYDDEGNSHSGMGIDAADILNKGSVNVAITNYQGQQTSLYSQIGPDIFRDDKVPAQLATDTGKVLGFGVLFVDYDNDGYKDIFQVNGHVQDDIQKREPEVRYAQPSLLFHNAGNGTFKEVGLASGAPFTDPIVGRGCACGDFDNDGRPDLLIATNNGPAHLWRNETPTGNHWLTLQLIGSKSCRDGIGVLVVVKTAAGVQRNEVRSGSSYLSQSDLRPHFGLGTETRADVEIHWPSGIVDKVAGAACDHIWKIHEGTGRFE
jgi:hypothetical protein